MKILSVNAGSSSLKFRLYEMPQEELLMKGTIERIGLSGGVYSIRIGDVKVEKEIDFADHSEAVEILLKDLVEQGIIKDLSEIKAVGHRVVHGGNKYSRSVVLTKRVVKEINEISDLAPLHNPASILGMNAFMENIPESTNVACFDTAFHQTMEPIAYLYPVPYEWYVRYDVRKYGFHGLSHKFITETMKTKLKKKEPNLIICHIGNGASISAIKAGKSIDTSMGFTPNSGIMMGTRCGDIDATILPYIMEETGMSAKEIDTALNKQSGLLGISGVSSDSRDIEDGINNGDERCILAQKMYVKRIVDYIAKYYVELGGCDAIIFTAGVGENSISTRMQVMEKLACLGVKPDAERNNVRGKEALITADNSKIPVYVIPTNEELMIATDTYNLAK